MNRIEEWVYCIILFWNFTFYKITYIFFKFLFLFIKFI